MDNSMSVETCYKAVVWNTDTNRWNTLIREATFEAARLYARNAWITGTTCTQVWRIDAYNHSYSVVLRFDQ